MEGENQDQLKVRVGSSWISFAEYMTQAKTRMERDAQEEEKQLPGQAQVNATLEEEEDSG